MQDNKFAAVGAIVLRGDDILLVRHTYGGAAGKLLNPSGFIRLGELPIEAVKREVREETGVEIAVRGLLAARCTAKNWWLVFLADYVSGTPHSDNAENSEVLFMPCKQALVHSDVTDSTKTLINLLDRPNLFTINEDYSSLPSSSDGRMMFS